MSCLPGKGVRCRGGDLFRTGLLGMFVCTFVPRSSPACWCTVDSMFGSVGCCQKDRTAGSYAAQTCRAHEHRSAMYKLGTFRSCGFQGVVAVEDCVCPIT